MCHNYEYDPPANSSAVRMLGIRTLPCVMHRNDLTVLYVHAQSPPPLCEFIQWMDLQQTREKRDECYRMCQAARREWDAQLEADNRRREWAQERRRTMETRRKEEEEERLRRELEAHRAAAAREAERQRMRERARRAREAGPDALRKGKWPRCTQ
jgi:hypothetical protein